MSVALLMEFDGMSLNDYDRVCEALHFPADWPDGLMVHGSTEVEGSLRVTDVWESREKFDAFAGTRLAAAFGEAMGDAAKMPEIVERPLHTLYAKEAVREGAPA